MNLKTEAYTRRKVTGAYTYVSTYFYNLHRFPC